MDNNLDIPFFSVIMPAYNAAGYIAEAIGSVIGQEFSNWELIVVNDGSTDATVSIVEQYINDKRITLISQENKKLGAARNTGISHAKGNWICFLDADDTWLPDKLKKQHRFILNNPQADVLFSDGYTFDQSINFRLPYHFNVAKGWYTGEEMYRIEFSGNSIPVLSACIKKSYCDIVGSQYGNITQGAEDWDYWLRLALAGANFYGMDERLFVYRIHEENMSAKNLLQQVASALVLIKNFRRELLPPEAINVFIKNLIALHNKLTKAGLPHEAKTLAKFISETYNNANFNWLKKLFGLTLALSVYGTTLKTTKPGHSLKYWMKKIFLSIIEFLFFKPYQYYQKHAHNFTIQYYRWQLGNRLETRGSFFISPKANLHITAKGSKFITYGIYINDFTQINMDRDRSYLLTGSNVMVNRFCNISIWEGSLIIGSNVSFNNYCSISCMEHIEIGDDTWLGEGVRLYDHNHQYKAAGIPFTRQGMATGAIKIGHNCWIGSNTVILQNVTIGDNCVIGANNLIYKSVPANTIIKARAMELAEPVHK
ncbi:glycosyltransferase [Mucilaginibacter sp.]|uniref:glycosyltransferase n=1 Tax=Mucilaginibacter sp. TaxID=1882438 RepID=UPI0035690D17